MHVIALHGDKKINLVIEEVADGPIVNFLTHHPLNRGQFGCVLKFNLN